MFEKVRFAYPTRKKMPIFSDLNLRIPGGKTVALVGLSGWLRLAVSTLCKVNYSRLPEGAALYAASHCGLRCHTLKDAYLSTLRLFSS